MKHSNNIPLIIDLDGSLIRTDTLFESCLLFIKKYPLRAFALLKWFWGGKAHLKNKLSKYVLPNAELLPYRTEVLELAQEAKRYGKKVYLITGANQKIADEISKTKNLFVTAIGSTTDLNLKGENKLAKIREVLGTKKFDYIGNSKSDLPIWSEARTAFICSNNKILRKSLKTISPNIVDIELERKPALQQSIKALRIYQWSKNVLVFLALFMSHRILEIDLLVKNLVAFVSFSLIASSVYILNDLFDLESDRKHPTKKHRPFASGLIPIISGVLSVPVLLCCGFLLSLFLLPNNFTLVLLLYFITTTAYSLYLKEILFIDVILLGALYTLRIIAGGLATGVEVSSWLLGFSGFFFLSLAFMKRYTDLLLFKRNSQEELFGRGYAIEDMDFVQKIGIASGFISLLILALYITSEQVFVLYSRPLLLWLTIPAVLYWLMRMWYMAHKGKMTDDPIIYAIKDKSSYVVFVLVLITTIAATVI